MAAAHLNRISTAVPDHDVHSVFMGFAERVLRQDGKHALFRRMAARAQIEHRWSCLTPAGDGQGAALDREGFYTAGRFPPTASRMRRFEAAAPRLAERAVAGLNLEAPEGITHLVTISCTGLFAPGIDFHLMRRFGLPGSVARTSVGFMGCYAAINGLRLAQQIVNADPAARVLLVSLELCTLHLQDTHDLEQVLSFMIFGDGCAAALVTADAEGLALDGFTSILVPQTEGHITWGIGDQGFDMVLSGQVPGSIGQFLGQNRGQVMPEDAARETTLWAVHPGGRSVLDAVQQAFDLPPEALAHSREVLRAFGNMSSATVLFVLAAMMRDPATRAGQTGCAMAFGPGIVAETMRFSVA
ncbi:type III polyketide synthase [Falsirhodobacter algicola]|uniref:Type III polyketide synthase n=1 Tax=Falsirhodobacter algicola TaxID=2692330 RepID=A0A8J8SM14_9RHOB|nr:type III polyketide synthase [Falsirhodobacter algicola]QUS37047.1 type III polyketide synthase [Falsirhodobacter algicola]